MSSSFPSLLVALAPLPFTFLSCHILSTLARYFLYFYLFCSFIGWLLTPTTRLKPFTPLSNSYILITGVTSGLGLQCVYQLCERGYNVICIGRQAVKLKEIQQDIKKKYPKVKMLIIVQDLSHTNAVPNILQELSQFGYEMDGSGTIHIDGLINNAGFGSTYPFLSQSLSTYTDMCQLHVLTLTQLTYELLPNMLKRKRGRILQVGSIIGFMPSKDTATNRITRVHSPIRHLLFMTLI